MRGLDLATNTNLSVRLLRVQKLKLTGHYQIKDWKLSLKLAHVQVFLVEISVRGLDLATKYNYILFFLSERTPSVQTPNIIGQYQK